MFGNFLQTRQFTKFSRYGCYVSSLLNLCFLLLFYLQMSTLIPKLMEEVTKKGQELVTFKQKHGIKLLDERDSQAVAMGAGGTKSGGSESMAAAPTTAVAGKGSSVLVSK